MKEIYIYIYIYIYRCARGASERVSGVEVDSNIETSCIAIYNSPPYIFISLAHSQFHIIIIFILWESQIC